MQRVFYPPQQIDRYEYENTSIFLGGTIDLGKAVDWQAQVIEELKDYPVDIYNPRRPNWDWNTPQSKDSPLFREQVLWELNAQREAHIICYNFTADGKSPVTLLELGLHHNDDIIVCCPPGFWRKGNVDIVCEHFGIPLVENIEDMIAWLQNRVDEDRSWQENYD